MASRLHIFGVLKIDPINENRCCGVRRDGMPCNNIVAMASRQSALNILRRCDEVTLDAAIIRKNFGDAAGLLLCKRWHQDQWSDIMEGWLHTYQQYQRTITINRARNQRRNDSTREQSASRSAVVQLETEHLRRHSRSTTTQRSVARPESEPERLNLAFENLITAILNSGISNDDKIAILRTATATSASGSTSTTTTSASAPAPAPAPAPASASTPAPNPASASSTTQHHTSRVARNIHSIPGTQMRTRTSSTVAETTTAITATPQNRQQSLTESLTEPSTPVRTNVTPSPTRVSRTHRLSHVDCGICLEPYDEAQDGGHWECRQCRNRVHLACHTQWSMANPLTTRCVYCRAVVRPIL